MYRRALPTIFVRIRTTAQFFRKQENWDEKGDKYFTSAVERKLIRSSSFLTDYPEKTEQLTVPPRERATYPSLRPSGLEPAEVQHLRD